MDGFSEQKVLYHTGSLSGYRPLQNLGSDYLSATHSFSQPLCGNKEGWGPLSPFRYDFTPCFIDVWIASVSAFGLVFGLGAVWLLKKRQEEYSSSKNFHFWFKQVRDIGACSMNEERSRANLVDYMYRYSLRFLPRM